MTTVTTVTYSANTAITLDLSNLATSSTFLGGQESSQIDNTSTLYVDAIVNVKGITSHASTAMTAGQEIRIYLWGADTSLATTAIDTLDGTGSAETLAHAGVLNSLRMAATCVVVTVTAGLVYYAMPFGVAQHFGGVMPKFWGIYVAHNHTGNLGASNNTLFSFNGITYTNT